MLRPFGGLLLDCRYTAHIPAVRRHGLIGFRDMAGQQGNRVVMMGIGPGLTLELILFRFHEPE